MDVKAKKNQQAPTNSPRKRPRLRTKVKAGGYAAWEGSQYPGIWGQSSGSTD